MTTFESLLGGLRDRPWDRVRALPRRTVDLLVVAVVGALTASDAAVNDPGYRQADRFTWLLLAVSLLALLGRRRWPVPVVVVTGAACAGWALYGHIGELLNLPVLVALYTLAADGSRRRTLLTGLAASLTSGAVAFAVGQDVANPQGLPVLEMLWPLVPLLLGAVVRTRRQLLDAYAARAARAEEEREREAERRVHAERVRIARELHDIVAHTVAAMTVQAGVALDALDVRPELSRQAMRQVRDSGKEAVRELRSTVTVLRANDRDGEPRAAAPGLGELPALVARFEGGGLTVALTREGPEEGLSAVTGLTAYRIVQEALTNVVRHSGARHAAVSTARRDGSLTVEVVDDGDGPPEAPAPAAPGGFGLVGMRERAAAAGGAVEHGPAPGGGFRVRARLPVHVATEHELIGEGRRA
ncbi:sensor histidine kinase [Streptomyces sp. NPDC048172]|uniref:sensor histidine kinase n=1 Tax=Streptomyces sp. NPDC048172 TaxID=3365505 RepID=UPI00371AC796